MIAAVHLGSQSVLGPIVSEERIVFGIVANVEKDTSMQQLEKEVAPVDLKGMCVCVCVCVIVSVAYRHTFACTCNMYYLDIVEAIMTRIYDPLLHLVTMRCVPPPGR